MVSTDQIQFPVFRQCLHKLQRNVNRIGIQQRTTVKPIACEYYVFDILFIRRFYYRFARVYADLQPGKLVPGQTAVQISEYYSFALKYIHVLNITTLEQTSAEIGGRFRRQSANCLYYQKIEVRKPPGL